MPGEALACPSCASKHPPDERFCPSCGMPLVAADGPATAALSERQERARKIKPQYTEGALVRVAGASNQAEAEFIQGMLLEEGVPSLVRRAAGFDVPDFMAGGPREVLVAASGAPTAREVLVGAEIVGDGPPRPSRENPARLIAGLLLGVAIVAVILFMGTHVWD
ncbi:MAG TPA: zinc-ribbon domain-containing protein [Solirubrobacteraceae bacterium]